MYACTQHACLGLMEAKTDLDLAELELQIDSYRLHIGSGSSEEQQMLLSPEPPLQTP